MRKNLVRFDVFTNRFQIRVAPRGLGAPVHMATPPARRVKSNSKPICVDIVVTMPALGEIGGVFSESVDGYTPCKIVCKHKGTYRLAAIPGV